MMKKNITTGGIVMNAHHIEIKVCCASCGYKQVSNAGVRMCRLLRERVPSSHFCADYELSRGMQNAGLRDGLVKRKEYLDFVRMTLLDELREVMAGQRLSSQRTTLDDLRSQWEKAHGSIYVEL